MSGGRWSAGHIQALKRAAIRHGATAADTHSAISYTARLGAALDRLEDLLAQENRKLAEEEILSRAGGEAPGAPPR